MSYQDQTEATVAYKVQSAQGSQESGTGATVLRTTGGQGAQLTKAATESNEVRRDMMRTRGRHGTQKTQGAWGGELSKGSHESIIEAIMRGTWAAATAITQATADLSAATITATGNVVTFSAGSVITAGVRVGAVHRWTAGLDAADLNKNLRVTAVTALAITYAETLTTVSTPASTYAFSNPGKTLINPAAGSLVERYFTLEEYMQGIDQSEVMTDFVWSNIKFSMQPNGIIMADPGGVGTGQFAALATGSSPLFTSPTESTSAPMSVVDATIRLNGQDVVDLTAFDLTMDTGASAPEVFGSGAQKYSPAVFTGQMGVSLNITALRKDLAYLANYIAEDVLSLHVLAVENESEPKDFHSIYVPNFTLGGVVKSALNKQGGAMTEQLSVPVALVGKDETGGAFDPTMIKFQSTGAA